MYKKSKDFRWEVSLGLALIILVLLILNIAAHYALYRVRESLENDAKDQLSEAAVVTANSILRGGGFELPDGVVTGIKDDYELVDLRVIAIDYGRVMAIQAGQRPDSTFLRLDNSLTARDLAPILRNTVVFRHKSGTEKMLLLFPTEYAGSKYVIALTQEDALLASVEGAGRTLMFFGVLGVVIILFVSSRFIHLVIYPFSRLKEKAVSAGRLDRSEGDEALQLVSSYERIIDELKQKEQELVELNEIISRKAADLEVYNNYVLKSVGAGIMTLDNRGAVATVNRAAGEMLDISVEKAVGEKYCEVFGPPCEMSEIVERYYETGESFEGKEARIQKKGKAARILSVSLSPLVDSRGERIGLSLILNDQTEYLKIREELELNRRMASLGEMSGGLAHQLRNSAAAMVGLARLIHKKSDPDRGVRETSDLLLKEAMQASELVARFLDFARPLQPEIEDLVLRELLEGILSGAREKYGRVSIVTEYDERRKLRLTGDSLLLKQAIGNVIDNACQAAGEGGNVSIETTESSEGIEIKIADDGPGIPDSFKERIFTPFFSGSPSGTGLGLSLARKIIALHGGRITFNSSPDAGTTFTIWLPSGRKEPSPANSDTAACRA